MTGPEMPGHLRTISGTVAAISHVLVITSRTLISTPELE